MKDEIFIWVAMIAGAVIEGLIITAFIVGFCAGDPIKVWALIVGFLCFGVVPQVWSLEQVNFFGDDRSEDDKSEDEDNA